MPTKYFLTACDTGEYERFGVRLIHDITGKYAEPVLPKEVDIFHRGELENGKQIHMVIDAVKEANKIGVSCMEKFQRNLSKNSN